MNNLDNNVSSTHIPQETDANLLAFLEGCRHIGGRGGRFIRIAQSITGLW